MIWVMPRSVFVVVAIAVTGLATAKPNARRPGTECVALVPSEKPEPRRSPPPEPSQRLLTEEEKDRRFLKQLGSEREELYPEPHPYSSYSAGQLRKSEIVDSMSRSRDAVECCHTIYQLAGLASVHLLIESDGTVRWARVEGRFAQTPTGACVEAVIKHTLFPKFSGPAMEITYPFLLR